MGSKCPDCVPVEILLVEDNPGDVYLIEDFLSDYKVFNNVHIARNGIEAMEFLNNQGKYLEVPRPDLILLDLNMPRKDGREVLAEIKKSDALRNIPVVVLTSSEEEREILKGYNLHVEGYVTKPVEFAQFIATLKSIEGFGVFVVKKKPKDSHGR